MRALGPVAPLIGLLFLYAGFRVADAQSPAEGDPCGDCAAGLWNASASTCDYPATKIDRTNGAPKADTGSRTVFRASDYGTGVAAINAAGNAAKASGGAVWIDSVVTVDNYAKLYAGVLYTGGGLKRKCHFCSTVKTASQASDTCLEMYDASGYTLHRQVLVSAGPGFADTLGTFTPTYLDGDKLCRGTAIGFAIPIGADVVATHVLAKTFPGSEEDGIVLDSVLFDGNESCAANSKNHDWRYNNAVSIRGKNVVKDSWFVDMQSENLVVCGAIVANNIADDLEGSFVHKSCGANVPDLTVGNYVEDVNQTGDAVMQHSEGVYVFSSNAGNNHSVGNVYRNGGEGAWGEANSSSEQLLSMGDCVARLPRRISFCCSADETTFRWVDLTEIAIGP